MEYQDHESIGYLTATVSQALADSLVRHFRAAGIDLPFSQFMLLMQLYQRDGQTQQELARVLQKDKAGIKRTVDNLVLRGLVARQASVGGTRNVPLRLTSKAIELREEVRRIYREHFGQVSHDIGKEELETTKETLRHIIRNIQVL